MVCTTKRILRFSIVTRYPLPSRIKMFNAMHKDVCPAMFSQQEATAELIGEP